MKNFTVYARLSLLLLFCFSAINPSSAQVLYGMTNAGGTAYGAIIKFNAATGNDSVVWNLAGAPSDGASPYGNLVYDPDNGLFYGMTFEGGSNSFGAIISFDPTTNKDSLVWSFSGYPSDGEYPFGDLVYDANNKLFYGMTGTGGSNEAGAIISFNPSTNTDSVVWNFKGVPLDGEGPQGDLVYDASNGLFYGMTGTGGSNSNGGLTCGTIISFDPATNKDSLLWSFRGETDGRNPAGNLIYDANTKLMYGITHYGGINDTMAGGYGAIISFNPATNKDSVVWSLAGATSDGEYPDGSFVYDTSNGSFYAMTLDGGANYDGAIISFNPSTNKESMVWSFGAGTDDGTHPLGNLVYDWGNNLLYGMTQWGGTNGTGPKDGTIISFDPNGNTEKVLWDFGSGTDGQQPFGALVLYGPSVGAGINQLAVDNEQLIIYPNPNNGNFTLQLKNIKQTTELEIFNVLGEKIYTATLNSAATPINLSNNAAGIYLYRVLDESGNQIGDGKFVIE